MNIVYICDAVRTPFGRYGGALSSVRTDDLAAIPVAALLERNPGIDPARIDDVILGCANQAGEDNRNVGRMALLLAGLPKEVSGSTVNRLCGSSLDAVVQAIGKDTKSKPEIPAPQGDPPPELVIRDIVKGKGPGAKAGDDLSMQYVGTSWSTGEQFDASWDRGAQPFTFPLGAGQVIAGWDEGIVGLRKGGRRLLSIPPDKGYGPNGTPDGTIAPNETLIFVVDRVD